MLSEYLFYIYEKSGVFFLKVYRTDDKKLTDYQLEDELVARIHVCSR